MASKVTHEVVSHDENHVKLIRDLATDVNLLIAAVNEINTWSETLAAKLNADGGVTDTDYDATIAAGQITASVSVPK